MNKPAYPAPPPAPAAPSSVPWDQSPPIIPPFQRQSGATVEPSAPPDTPSVAVLRALLADRLAMLSATEHSRACNESHRKAAIDTLDHYTEKVRLDTEDVTAIETEIREIQANIKKIGGRVD